MKQVWVHQIEGVTPPPPLPGDHSVQGHFGGHPSGKEVASPDITIVVLFLYFILVTKHSSVLGTLGRLIELDLGPHLQGFALSVLIPFLPLL